MVTFKVGTVYRQKGGSVKVGTELAALKQEIDEMPYESMLRLWRTAPAGHPMFKGEIGKYYSEQMAKKRERVGPAAHVAASKSIGW